MYRTVIWGILMLLGVAFGGPDPAGADDADVVAKIGERKITRAEFQEFIDATPMKGQKDLQSPTFQKDVLRTMVLRKVLADKARKAGLDKRKDTALAVENAVNTVLSSALLEEEVRKKIEVTDEDIQLYYRMHRAEFKVPEQVKASHILVKVATFAAEEERAKAQEEAEQLLKRVRAGEDFAKLAEEFSDDPGSKKKGGDLGFFSRGKMIKTFEDAAFSLKAGEVSDLVKTQFGYHIIKVEEKRAAGQEPLENVRGKIKQKIFDERREIKAKEYAEQALRDANAEIYPEVLDKK